MITLLREQFPDLFAFSVSHTTRSPREKEQHGIHYYFVTKEEFLKLKEENSFIENAEYAGNYYGTSYHTLNVAKENKKIVLLDIDIQGIKTIKQVWNEERGVRPAFIQIVPPSYSDLRKRLVGRGDTAEEAIKKRLETALKELTYTMEPNFFDHIVVNDDLHVAAKKLAFAINETQK